MPLLIMEAFPKQHESFISPSQPSVHMYVHWRKSCIQNLSSAPPKKRRSLQKVTSSTTVLYACWRFVTTFSKISLVSRNIWSTLLHPRFRLPICCRKSWLPTEKRTRILIFTLSRQIVQSPSTASLTALWTWRWLDRIPAMRAVSFFLSVRMNLSLQPR